MPVKSLQLPLGSTQPQQGEKKGPFTCCREVRALAARTPPAVRDPAVYSPTPSRRPLPQRMKADVACPLPFPERGAASAAGLPTAAAPAPARPAGPLPEAVAWRRRRVPAAAGPEHGGARRAAAPRLGPAAPAGRFLRGRGAGQPGGRQLRDRAAGCPGFTAAAGRRRGGRAAAARPAPPRVGAAPPPPPSRPGLATFRTGSHLWFPPAAASRSPSSTAPFFLCCPSPASSPRPPHGGFRAARPRPCDCPSRPVGHGRGALFGPSRLPPPPAFRRPGSPFTPVPLAWEMARRLVTWVRFSASVLNHRFPFFFSFFSIKNLRKSEHLCFQHFLEVNALRKKHKVLRKLAAPLLAISELPELSGRKIPSRCWSNWQRTSVCCCVRG